LRKPVRINRAPDRQAAAARPTRPQAAVPTQQGSPIGQGCGVVLVIILVLFLIGKCSSGPVSAPADPAQAAVPEPAYVAARSLNCRRSPDASAAVAESLKRGDQVVVAERSGDWARLTRAGGDCWVSGSFLTSAPEADGASPGSTASGAQGLMSSAAGTTAVAAGAGYVASRAVHPGRRHAGSHSRRHSGRGRSSGGGYSGSGCPCSGSQVCIGPRGGRYCITSGGNKRYGV
jgi:SH3-like domain-containing protein